MKDEGMDEEGVGEGWKEEEDEDDDESGGDIIYSSPTVKVRSRSRTSHSPLSIDLNMWNKEGSEDASASSSSFMDFFLVPPSPPPSSSSSSYPLPNRCEV